MIKCLNTKKNNLFEKKSAKKMHYKNPKHVCDETNDQMSETHFLYKKIFNLLQNSRIEITVWYVIVLFDLDGL